MSDSSSSPRTDWSVSPLVADDEADNFGYGCYGESSSSNISNSNNNSNKNNRSNNSNHNYNYANPSPMFSDDMGPATPLVLDSMDSEPNPFLNNTANEYDDDDGGGGELKSENDRLRNMVGIMRKEMEELTNQLLLASPDGKSQPQSSSDAAAAAASSRTTAPQLSHSSTRAALAAPIRALAIGGAVLSLVAVRLGTSGADRIQPCTRAGMARRRGRRRR